MKILALDVATTTGVCVGDTGADPRAWSLYLGDSKAHEQRFNQALIMTQGLVHAHNPDLVVVEAAIGGHKANAYLIGLVACIRAVCANRGVNCKSAHLSTVRRHFLGEVPKVSDYPGMKPQHAKRKIKERVMQQCADYGWPVDTDDEADAVAIWNWACAEFGPAQTEHKIPGLFSQAGQ